MCFEYDCDHWDDDEVDVPTTEVDLHVCANCNTAIWNDIVVDEVDEAIIAKIDDSIVDVHGARKATTDDKVIGECDICYTTIEDGEGFIVNADVYDIEYR